MIPSFPSSGRWVAIVDRSVDSIPGFGSFRVSGGGSLGVEHPEFFLYIFEMDAMKGLIRLLSYSAGQEVKERFIFMDISRALCFLPCDRGRTSCEVLPVRSRSSTCAVLVRHCSPRLGGMFGGMF